MEKVWDPLRRKMVALTPEEKVRQWFISVLMEKMGVPAHMMMSEVSFKFGDKPFRADILVYGRDTAPILIVECKREDVALDRDVLEQALRYNLALSVRYIIITNGHQTFGFKRNGVAGQAGCDTADQDMPFERMSSFPDWDEMRK
ncbi:MAG: type I restriction enzyme HsdR N-terminal domain-containing protein [Bacteroidales bacterium]|nr:type I restriction enzyme HsdR N-terminal domain-containing protein [Bacteroidales bacterium]